MTIADWLALGGLLMTAASAGMIYRPLAPLVVGVALLALARAANRAAQLKARKRRTEDN